MTRWTRLRGDLGQVAVALGLALVVLAATTAILVGRLGRVVNDRSRARLAADAAALAGVPGGRSAAAQVAAENGGTLKAFLVEGVEVEADVQVGTARARSRAAPGGPGGPSAPITIAAH